MSFSELYERVQKQEHFRIKVNWIRDQVIALTHVTAVKEQWTEDMDPEIIRGFYIEGPLGPPVPLDENEVLIVLTKPVAKDMRRVVYAKELMHAFDTDDERADTPEKYDLQVERFGNPDAPNSPQYRAESKAFLRALAVLCQEKKRIEFREAVKREEMTLEMVASALKLPIRFVREMMRDEFEAIIEQL